MINLLTLSLFLSSSLSYSLFVYFVLACNAKMYLAAGRLLSYMLALGGVLPQVMAPVLYAIVAYGKDHVQPQIHDVLDVNHQMQLLKVIQYTVGICC